MTQGSKAFFSVEKKQKTFKHLRGPLRTDRAQRIKVFCFFSSEKKALLPSYFEIVTNRTHRSAAPHHRFAERSRRTQAITPRGIGTIPRSGFTSGTCFRARTGALAPGSVAGRNTAISIANIRHTGRNT